MPVNFLQDTFCPRLPYFAILMHRAICVGYVVIGPFSPFLHMQITTHTSVVKKHLGVLCIPVQQNHSLYIHTQSNCFCGYVATIYLPDNLQCSIIIVAEELDTAIIEVPRFPCL